ncbi:hypothetical protein FACS189411_06430 [Bacteroidia bacterium]|nr:hypothetical protein FACS189411_06430 [Bacteroidia bacterium]
MYDSNSNSNSNLLYIIGFWKYNKGHFRLEELGKATLFLNSGHGPYLLIYSSNHDPIIINRSSPEENRQLYEKLTH